MGASLYVSNWFSLATFKVLSLSLTFRILIMMRQWVRLTLRLIGAVRAGLDYREQAVLHGLTPRSSRSCCSGALVPSESTLGSL